jgi:hypothetical protein
VLIKPEFVFRHLKFFAILLNKKTCHKAVDIISWAGHDLLDLQSDLLHWVKGEHDAAWLDGEQVVRVVAPSIKPPEYLSLAHLLDAIFPKLKESPAVDEHRFASIRSCNLCLEVLLGNLVANALVEVKEFRVLENVVDHHFVKATEDVLNC